MVDCGFVKLKGYDAETGIESLAVRPNHTGKRGEEKGRWGRGKKGGIESGSESDNERQNRGEAQTHTHAQTQTRTHTHSHTHTHTHRHTRTDAQTHRHTETVK